ncbi:hypothetical protein LV779_17585 [Streptomyces thinghirensis]|nr:hypothetical protein [Streptomyces thinghirensis]
MLSELDALIAELEPVGLNSQMLRLIARSNRVIALSGLRRYAEAETAALGILSELTRIAHRAPVAGLELNTLEHLATALCGLGRHEEAEAVTACNLTRASGPAAGVLYTTLARSPERPGPLRGGAGRGPAGCAAAAPLRLRVPGSGHRRGPVRPGAPSEAGTAVRRALTDCERRLHPAHPRYRGAGDLLGRITGEREGGRGQERTEGPAQGGVCRPFGELPSRVPAVV